MCWQRILVLTALAGVTASGLPVVGFANESRQAADSSTADSATADAAAIGTATTATATAMAPATTVIEALPALSSPIADAARARRFDEVKALVAQEGGRQRPHQRWQHGVALGGPLGRSRRGEAALEGGCRRERRPLRSGRHLYLAAVNGSPSMIKLLLSKHADPNARVLAIQATPLMYAATLRQCRKRSVAAACEGRRQRERDVPRNDGAHVGG